MDVYMNYVKLTKDVCMSGLSGRGTLTQKTCEVSLRDHSHLSEDNSPCPRLHRDRDMQQGLLMQLHAVAQSRGILSKTQDWPHL